MPVFNPSDSFASQWHTFVGWFLPFIVPVILQTPWREWVKNALSFAIVVVAAAICYFHDSAAAVAAGATAPSFLVALQYVFLQSTSVYYGLRKTKVFDAIGIATDVVEEPLPEAEPCEGAPYRASTPRYHRSRWEKIRALYNSPDESANGVNP